jgi:hypothetical protein
MGELAMYRLLICLPLCLFLAPDPELEQAPKALAPSAAAQDPLPSGDPLTFLEKCLDRYDSQAIRGYTMIMHKQERIGGVLQPSEEVEVFFREKPHSVFLHWLKGQRKAESVLYVDGENGGKMLAKPAGIGGIFVKVAARDVDGDDAKQSGRYSLKEFGLRNNLVRTLQYWKAAKGKGALDVRYLGVRKVREAGDRLCYTLRRFCKEPEDDGCTDMTFYIDKETWLRVGAVLKDATGKLMGEYMFRDIHINPEFKPNQFQASILSP